MTSTDPDAIKSHTDLGQTLLAQGDKLGAACHYALAFALDPTTPFDLQTFSLPDAKLTSSFQALKENPLRVEPWLALAQIFKTQNRLDCAFDCFFQAHQINPTHAPTLVELRDVSIRLKHMPIAIEALLQLRKIYPTDPLLMTQLGACLAAERRYPEAIIQFKQAYQLNPSPQIRAQLALCYQHGGYIEELNENYPEALTMFREALRLNPQDYALYASILHNSQYLCLWEDRPTLLQKIHEGVRKNIPFLLNPMATMTIPGLSRLDLKNCFVLFHKSKIAPLVTSTLPKPDWMPGQTNKGQTGKGRQGKIKIGYLSSDFRDHVTTWLLAEVIELHDRSRFEIYAYSYSPSVNTPMRARLLAAFDHFEEIQDLTDEAAAHKIRMDKIDILVDLNGYSGKSRSQILGFRPSPIQINYLGFPGTSGADYVDYIIADSIVIPPGYEDGYTEKVLRLPHCYQANDRQRPLPPPAQRSDFNLPQDGFVFCSFNSAYKTTPEIFDIWCRLLKNIPHSVLWIYSNNILSLENLKKEAKARDVEPTRIIQAYPLSAAAHMARLRCVDLCLDTFPYTGHTTTSDALWVGVPVVTMIGETFPSRVAASLLHAVDLPDLIAKDWEDYYTIAHAIATNPERLQALKDHLERVRMTCPAFDSPQYTKDLETLYVQAVETYKEAHHT